MQTILGAGGSIGKELAKALRQYTQHVRLVSRTPKKIHDTDELIPADLTNKAQVEKAVEGSEIVYLVAGLEYKAKVWQAQWPLIMQNVIDACRRNSSKLVFFDNAYMYDRNHLANLTEETPVNPSSKKGLVRAHIAAMVGDAVKRNEITAMIVRASDFYGPGVQNSVMMETVYKNLEKGKKAMWMGDPSRVHSMTFVPDAARATALLGNTADTYNQVWHLPTSSQKITGQEWIALFAASMKKEPKYTSMSTGVIKVIGLFNSFLREFGEMMYQFDRDYFFSSEKFQKRFPEFKITEPADGVKATTG